MKKFLLALAVSLGVSGCSPLALADQAHGVNTPVLASLNPTPSQVYKDQRRMIEEIAKDYPLAEDTEVVWLPCDEENSAYSPSDNRIELCTEMSEHPAAAVMFAAHEMAHSVTTHYFDTHSEFEADELGTLEMLAHGRADQVLDAALYYQAQETQGHTPGDPHPDNALRARELVCLEDGWEKSRAPHPPKYTPSECESVYTGLVTRYKMMFDSVKPTAEFDVDLDQLLPLIKPLR